MIESGENLSLFAEMSQHGVCVHPAFDNLDRDAFLVLLIRAFRQVNRSHSAAAEFAHQAVWADELPRLESRTFGLKAVIGQEKVRPLDKGAGLVMGREK